MGLFKNATLRKNLTIWLIAAVLVSTSFSFLIYYKFSENSLIDSVKNDLDNVSKSQSAFIDYWLKSHLEVMESLALSPAMLSQDPSVIQEHIENYNKIYSEFSEIAFINSDGKLIQDSLHKTSVNVSDREYFIAAKNKKEFISDAIVSRTTNEPIIVLSSPVFIGSEFKGTVVGAVNLSSIAKIISAERFINISQSYIANKNGEVVTQATSEIAGASTQNPSDVHAKIDKSFISRAFSVGSFIERYTNLRGNKILGSYTLLTNKDWVLVHEVDITKNINAMRKSSAEAGLLAIMSIFILSIPFILYLSRKLTTPMNNIVDVVSELSAGNFDKRIDFRSNNEIGALAQSFNTMADKLQSIYNELKDRIADLNSQKEETNIKNLKLEQVIEVNKTILEQLEEKNKQLEQGNRLKAEFLANMSHEFRTPMNSIIGYTEMIMDGNDGEVNEEQKKDLAIILKSAEKLLGIINDVLDLSKIEAGKMAYKFKKFNLVDEMLSLIENIKVMSQSKGLDLIFEYSDIPEIYSDSVKINNIISNILSNAVKFTDTGYIKVQLSLDDNQFANIAVTDTGIGIPEEELNSVFDEFRQIDGSSTRKYGGTGLGLTIAKGLIEGLGGSISVTSKLGSGSTFTVKIPVAKTTAALEKKAVEELPPPAISAQSERSLIVVVTRNTSNYNAIENILSRYNFKVVITDYTKSIETVKALRPQCVFVDIDLPCTNCNDGWLTLSDLKQDKTTSNIPLVVVSTENSNHLGFILGASDYLVKPFTAKDILNTIERSTQKHNRGFVLLIEENKETCDLVSKIIRKNTPFNTLIVQSRRDIHSVLESSNLPVLIVINMSLSSIKPIEIINIINSVDIERKIPIIGIAEKNLGSLEYEFIKQNTNKILYKSDIRHSKLVTEIKKLLFEIKDI